MAVDLQDPDNSLYEILINGQPIDFRGYKDPLMEIKLNPGDNVAVVRHPKNFYNPNWNSIEPHDVVSEKEYFDKQDNDKNVRDFARRVLSKKMGLNDGQIDYLIKEKAIYVSLQNQSGYQGESRLVGLDKIIDVMAHVSGVVAVEQKYLSSMNIKKAA